MTTWKSGVSAFQKIARTRSSVAASRKMPAPEIAARLDAGPAEQLAPPARGIEVRDIHRFRIERQSRGPQARNSSSKQARTVHVDLDQKVLTALRRHQLSPVLSGFPFEFSNRAKIDPCAEPHLDLAGIARAPRRRAPEIEADQSTA